MSPALLTSSAERRGPSLVGSGDDSVGSTIRRPWRAKGFLPFRILERRRQCPELGAGDGLQQRPLRVDSARSIAAKSPALSRSMTTRRARTLRTRSTAWPTNFGINEAFEAAVQAHLKKTGEFPLMSRARPKGGADLGRPNSQARRARLRRLAPRFSQAPDCFTEIHHKSLKSLSRK